MPALPGPPHLRLWLCANVCELLRAKAAVAAVEAEAGARRKQEVLPLRVPVHAPRHGGLGPFRGSRWSTAEGGVSGVGR